MLEIPWAGHVDLERRPVARGSYIGAECLLGNTPHKCSAVAQSSCRLLRLHRDTFDAIIMSQTDEEALDEDDEGWGKFKRKKGSKIGTEKQLERNCFLECEVGLIHVFIQMAVHQAGSWLSCGDVPVTNGR